MQLATAASAARPTSFQRQVGALVTQLDHALEREAGTTDTDLTFAAIDASHDILRSAYRRSASDEAKHDMLDAYDMLRNSREVIATNWSLEPPHIEVGYGDIGRMGVRRAVELLNQAIAEA